MGGGGGGVEEDKSFQISDPLAPGSSKEASPPSCHISSYHTILWPTEHKNNADSPSHHTYNNGAVIAKTKDA